MNWTLRLNKLVEKIPTKQKNIRTIMALEFLIENLDKIPIEEIEKLNEKYGV